MRHYYRAVEAGTEWEEGQWRTGSDMNLIPVAGILVSSRIFIDKVHFEYGKGMDGSLLAEQ